MKCGLVVGLMVAAGLEGLIGPAPKTVAPFELLMFRTDELVLQLQ